MKLIPGQWKSIVFDCDGVLLNSNATKAGIWAEVVSDRYGEKVASEFVAYATTRSGIGRETKIEYLLSNILSFRGDMKHEYAAVFSAYGKAVREKIVKCEQPSQLRSLLQFCRNEMDRVYIVSGAEQSELRWAMQQIGIDSYFDGIYGSPRSKVEIFNELTLQQNLPTPTLFIGDAWYDYEVAQRQKLDFLFCSKWTEFEDWQNYFKDKSTVGLIETLDDIII